MWWQQQNVSTWNYVTSWSNNVSHSICEFLIDRIWCWSWLLLLLLLLLLLVWMPPHFVIPSTKIKRCKKTIEKYSNLNGCAKKENTDAYTARTHMHNSIVWCHTPCQIETMITEFGCKSMWLSSTIARLQSHIYVLSLSLSFHFFFISLTHAYTDLWI